MGADLYARIRWFARRKERLTFTVSNSGPIAAFLTAEFSTAFSRLFYSHSILRKDFGAICDGYACRAKG